MSQSISKTKTTIAQTAYHTFRDLAHVFVCIILFVTVVRFLPLLRDIRAAGTINPGNYVVQFHIRKHVGAFIDDVKEMGKFVLLLTLVVVTVFAALHVDGAASE